MTVAKQAIDPLTVAAFLETNGMDELVGGAAYVTELANNTPSAANIEAYADIVVERARLRRAIELGTTLAGDAFAAGAQSEQVLADAARKLMRMQTSRLRGGMQHVRELVPAWLKRMQELSARGDVVTGLATPWSEFNRITHGLQDGDLIIIAGRPNMGKTVMGLQIALKTGLAGKRRVSYVSLEMTAQQLMARCVSAYTGVLHDWLLSPTEDDQDAWAEVTRATVALNQSSLLIDETHYQSIENIEARLRRAHMQAPIGLIVVDHLHEIVLRGTNSSERTHELGDVASRLKNLGKEFRCPVIALAQLNRELLKRNDRRPEMGDLRASGDIEQKADLIIFLHREDYYDAKTHMQNVVEVKIGKGRDIKTGEVIHLRNAFDKMRLDEWVGELPLPPVAGETKKTRKSGKGWSKKDPVAEALDQ